ncbi:hypothetical protein GIB67_030160 [Kingdonia uniflora]|uniref:DNA topoisomerase 2 n=1 Tax=Kingdonia uniflora TaxID=39325 RepID=A0A7J7LEG1_9MAGN|nr:hypothetical protein GIB67_030160 [Kingdonia uniflora]
MEDNEPIDDLSIYRATRYIGNDLNNMKDGSAKRVETIRRHLLELLEEEQETNIEARDKIFKAYLYPSLAWARACLEAKFRSFEGVGFGHGSLNMGLGLAQIELASGYETAGFSAIASLASLSFTVTCNKIDYFISVPGLNSGLIFDWRVPIDSDESFWCSYHTNREFFYLRITDVYVEFVIETANGKRQKRYKQVSYVNSIATIKGGTHVDYDTNQLANHVMNIVNKKNKSANLKAHTMKGHLWVFVNALVGNPAFDSQTKETLTTRQISFRSKCELSQDFLKKVAKSRVVESHLSWAYFKQKGDSAKALAVSRHASFVQENQYLIPSPLFQTVIGYLIISYKDTSFIENSVNKICHRNLKLENMHLDGSTAPRPRICDFGYSKSSVLHSQPKSTVGTPAILLQKSYPKREYDGKVADVWSWGVTLYVMLVGAYPFEDPRNFRKTIGTWIVQEFLWKNHVLNFGKYIVICFRNFLSWDPLLSFEFELVRKAGKLVEGITFGGNIIGGSMDLDDLDDDVDLDDVEASRDFVRFISELHHIRHIN